MRRLLVTGGAGFIGGNFVLDQVGSGAARAVTLDKLGYAGNRATLAALDGNPRHRLVEGDIRDRGLVARLLREHDPQVLVNFAAESHVDRSIDSPRAFIETNIGGVFELLEAVRDHLAGGGAGAREGFRFIQVSTDEVFGDLGDGGGAFTEASAYAPSSPYAASKAAADHLARAWARTYGLPVIITNCSNNYGPYQYPEKLIPLMILNALDGKPLPLYGDGGQVRDWLHVGDHCAAMKCVIERGRPGESYLIGGRSRCTNRALIEKLCAILDRLVPRAAGRAYAELIERVDDRPGHDRRYAIDPTKIERALGWRAAIDLDSGLEQTVRWYLDNEAWWRPIRDKAYGGERLGRLRRPA